MSPDPYIDHSYIDHPHIEPPRMPDPSLVPNPNDRRALQRTASTTWAIEKQRLEDKVRQLERQLEEAREQRNALLDDRDERKFAELSADDTGLYVTHLKTGRRYTLVTFKGELERRAEETLEQGRKGLCWYPYLQDERCKLPEGHICEHGPRHQCNRDCTLSEDGCTLPVPANPAAYYKALYLELHGSSCPPTCRGHAGG